MSGFPVYLFVYVINVLLRNNVLIYRGWRDSSFGIATLNRLERPGIESRWRRDFPHPSSPVLRPIQPPIQSEPVNHLTPNGHYMSRTAALTSRRYILYIYSTNICTEYFKHAA